MRWIDLGLFNLQPSELAKVFIIIYLASFLERHLPEVQESWSGFIKPMGVISAAVVLLHFEPDHGAMVILLLTAFCMVFLAGAKFYRFLFMLVICSGAVVAIAITKPYVLLVALGIPMRTSPRYDSSLGFLDDSLFVGTTVSD